MDTNTLKPALLMMITALGVSIPAPDFVGSLLLALFSAILAAVWTHDQDVVDRMLTVAAGMLAGLVIVIGHEEFLPDLSVQIKAVLAGLTGRYLLSFVICHLSCEAQRKCPCIRRCLQNGCYADWE